MKVTIAIDSFKGSLSSDAAGQAAAEGILTVLPHAKTQIFPLADGGEGTVHAITSALGGKRCRVRVCGPLGDSVEAEYGVIAETRTAIIEMSAAAGITLIPAEKRNPLLTTTYGVGELITHAIREHHCNRFLIGIGGSATNDGGVGMLQALGFSFLDSQGNEIPRGARGLASLDTVCCDGAMQELTACEFSIACDVTNPLCGELGCSAVYGPQKGATPDMIRDMDRWLSHYATLSEDATGRQAATAPGAGAAGGMGFSFLSYLGGELKSGIQLVMDAIRLEDAIRDSDVVITGEGRLDGQTAMGKAPVGVARLAKKHGKPVLAFAGCVTEEATACNKEGIDAFFPILPAPCSPEVAMNPDNAYENMKRTVEQVFRLIHCFHS